MQTPSNNLPPFDPFKTLEQARKRQILNHFKKTHDAIIVMSLKPKYAKLIYDGKKHWEFRKAPPPMSKLIYIYESAPVSKITGTVYFVASIRSVPSFVWSMATSNCFFPKSENKPGITEDKLREYAGKSQVTALRVFKPVRFSEPVDFEGKPPQNWGTFYVDKPEEVK